MHDSEEWREVQRKLGALEKDQTDIKRDIGDIKRSQEMETKDRVKQHEENQKEIATVKKVLLGDPENLDENPGIVTKLDRILVSGKTTAFWGKVIAGLLGLLLTYIGAREALSNISQTDVPHIFSAAPLDPVYAKAQKQDASR